MSAKREALMTRLVGAAVAIEMTEQHHWDRNLARLLREAAAEFAQSPKVRAGILDGSFPLKPNTR